MVLRGIKHKQGMMHSLGVMMQRVRARYRVLAHLMICRMRSTSQEKKCDRQ